MTVAEIPRRRTIAEVLKTYQDRIYSSQWRVPDNIYPQALSDLQTWVEQRFESTDAQIESQYTVTLTATYDWS
ncbi:MAG TPA: hypothetical protein ACFE0H_02570 [Elainellaceae cyanobacterium]